MTTFSLRAAPRLRSLRVGLARPELAGLLALATVLNLWALGRNGWANDYYSAAVRSMAADWHDFLYGSFDPAGVMTVDKPPLALWVQALSVRAFGYGSLSMLVPQALMGVGSVWLVYDLVRRRFGRAAGFAGGVALALTPIAVAISRHNNPDALLVLLSVAALWFSVRALEDGRTKWLVWAGVMAGLAFETKMAAALLVVPGIVAAWLWVATRGHLAAVRSLLAGGAAMAVVGLAWPVLVWLTPSTSRPWVSGTSDNSIWSLIMGYNGVGRLNGQAGGPQVLGGGPGGGTPGGGPGGGVFGGPTGALRLLDSSLGGQAGWLLGFAVVAGVAVVLASRLRRGDARTGWIIAVGGAFATSAVAFSYAQGIFHPYYVSLLAPFAAALVGAGVGQLAEGGPLFRVIAPPAVALGVIAELVVLGNSGDPMTWVAPLIVGVGAPAAAVLATQRATRVRLIAVGAAVAALLAAPAVWSAQTLGHATSGTFPAGGAAIAETGRGGPGGGPGGDTSSLSEAIAYAKANGGGTIGVSGQNGGASTAIIESGADVAGLGGFSGRESQVSVAWLAEAVRDGRIRYVLTTGGGMGGPADGRVGSSDLMAVVEQVGAATSVDGLSDLSGLADELAAAAR